MATLNWPTTAANDRVVFTPISNGLVNLRNGAGTIAVLTRTGSATLGEFAGVTNAGRSAWYHGLLTNVADSKFHDDDGVAGTNANTLVGWVGVDGTDFKIAAVTWPDPSGGAALERFHLSTFIDGAGTFTHENSTGNNGGTPAANASGTSGLLNIGDFGDGVTMRGDIALVGIWNAQLSDAQIEALFGSKQTSNWWNNSGGQPTTLIECTSLTPTDIGSGPSTFSSRTAGVTLTGFDPTGWTFDGRGQARPFLPEFPARHFGPF